MRRLFSFLYRFLGLFFKIFVRKKTFFKKKKKPFYQYSYYQVKKPQHPVQNQPFIVNEESKPQEVRLKKSIVLRILTFILIALKAIWSFVFKTRLKYIFWAFCLIGLLLFLFIYGLVFFMTRVSILEFFMLFLPQTQLNGVNILAFGIDDTKGVQRADTIVVFHLDPERHRIGALSIPRDTRVDIAGHGLKKINHAYAYGGVTLLKQSVSKFLGIPIHYYVRFNLEGVAKIVDEIGGINMDVDKNMLYRDEAGDLYIDLKKGSQDLKGSQVVQYLRFRHDNEGDIGRIHRQQKFMQAMAKKVTETGRLIQLPSIIRRVSAMVETDLSTREMINLAVQFGDSLSKGNVDKATVPGEVGLIAGVSYWKPDMTRLDKLMENVIMGIHQEATVNRQVKTVDVKASQDNRRQLTLKEVSRAVVQAQDVYDMANLKMSVEILNGYGAPQVAFDAAAYFKSWGAKVNRVHNAGSFSYKETLIVDWKGDVNKTVAIAKLLGIDASRIIVYDRPNKTLDITIVLGNDWPALKSKLKYGRHVKK